MKKVRVLIALAVAAALLVGVFAFSASAAMTLNVSLDKSQVEVGDTVTATVSVDNYATPLAGFAVTINYDANAFTLTAVNPVNYGGEAVVEPEDLANADGTITLVWFTAEPEGIVTVNKLADLTFTAKAEADSSSITAGFKSDGMINAGETLAPADPDVYDDTVASAPAVDVVPEGSLGGDEPVDPPAGGGSMAGDSLTAAGSSGTSVKATYSIGERTDMYKVDVEWGSLQFTYTEAAETWDPENHAWVLNDESVVGTWAPVEDGVSNKISLVNHSSQPVTVAFSFEDSLENDTITAEFGAESVTLNAVAGVGQAATVDSKSVTFNLVGKYTNESAEALKVGTVTASIR